MSVVNVKVRYIRPRYNNLEEWCQKKNHVYIARKGIVFIDGERYPKKDSKWCNPYKVGKDMTREESLKLYRRHLREMLKDEENLQEFLLLKGKKLGCWCKEDDKEIACHGDIILHYLNKYS